MPIPFIEDNDQTIARREHLDALRELVGNTYPNRFERTEIVEIGKEDTITAIVEKFRDFEPKEELKSHVVRIAGRLASPPRAMGKTAFVHLSDGISRLQIYVRRDDVKGVRRWPPKVSKCCCQRLLRKGLRSARLLRLGWMSQSMTLSLLLAWGDWDRAGACSRTSAIDASPCSR